MKEVVECILMFRFLNNLRYQVLSHSGLDQINNFKSLISTRLNFFCREIKSFLINSHHGL